MCQSEMKKIELVSAALCLLLFCQAVNCGCEGLVAESYLSLGLETSGVRPSLEPWAGQQKRRITELTHALRPELPSFGDENPVGHAVKLVVSMQDGSDFNLSELKLIVHTGTHLDAPGHYVNEHYEAGLDVNSLDLDILVGPVLIVDTPRDSNITAQVLEKLNIPLGVQRVLFRTSNTDKRLMWIPKFDSSYIGLTSDGAEWLVTHRPSVKLIGTDYLSVAAMSHLAEAHRILLRKKLILVEGLDLDNVIPGLSTLYCLPLRLLKAEGSPARCILID